MKRQNRLTAICVTAVRIAVVIITAFAVRSAVLCASQTKGREQKETANKGILNKIPASGKAQREGQTSFEVFFAFMIHNLWETI
ncbi:MAG: hypothetical protein LBH75_04320 [Treponema sp.]|jgi:uncharacterized MAPEG superfamily protein|nr:hypothetical protein [Treponema sp.]